ATSTAAATTASRSSWSAAMRSRRSRARASAEADHDALLRRLRELGELHRTGVLTDEEFTLAKQAILKRM
ncbi:SHOCT domain-containing protein, partial [Streptomyces sp. NPDC002130]|uniref:SHOCT domain-containing protein n=1 Tax=Streptomyces sp. NPDC002130 TaxID=3155568 RepID=UPI0033275CED